jgi:hypothetical protein
MHGSLARTAIQTQPLSGLTGYQERRKEGRMYYCGGPNKEQAGTVLTYNASRLYATVINGPIAVEA